MVPGPEESGAAVALKVRAGVPRVMVRNGDLEAGARETPFKTNPSVGLEGAIPGASWQIRGRLF